MTNAVTGMQDAIRGFFGELLGITVVSAEPERVVAEMFVRDDLCTIPGVLHGGAVMALADQIGAMATVLNLDRDKGYGTTTIESKTNFLSAGRAGTKVTAECVPLHRGGRLMTWQTTVRGEDGKIVAVTTQTQLVIEPRRGPKEQLAAMFEGKSTEEQMALLAELERGGADVYRALAAQEADPANRERLLAAALREEENAAALGDVLGP